MFSKCQKLLFKAVTLLTETKAGVIQGPCIENGWYKLWGNRLRYIAEFGLLALVRIREGGGGGEGGLIQNSM